MKQASSWAVLLIALLTGCGGGDSDEGDSAPPTGNAGYQWSLPTGFPTPKEFADNPLTAAKVKLGRHLFYDLRMSVNQTTACATCHLPERAFTDGRKTAIGATGEAHPRNAMSLTNVVYNATQNWANPVVTTLHAQGLIPMFGEFPLELGWSDHEAEILARFRNDAQYQSLFATAYPGETDPINADRVVKAIAAFESILISGNSPYDQATFQGNRDAMSAAARRGAVGSCSFPSGWSVSTATAGLISASQSATRARRLRSGTFSITASTTLAGPATIRWITGDYGNLPSSLLTWGGSGPQPCGISN